VVVSNRRVDLIEEGIDVAIRVRTRLDTDADLQVKIIAETATFLVASPRFVEAHGLPSKPADIASFATVSHTDRPGLDRWTLANAAGQQTIVEHEPRVSASTFPILFQAAIDGVGIALIPEFAAREALKDGRLVRVLPDWSYPDGIVHAVFTSRRGLLPGVRAVIDFVAEVLDPRSQCWQHAV
jgi:DNA-binding transcriptional LysR family regulator